MEQSNYTYGSNSKQHWKARKLIMQFDQITRNRSLQSAAIHHLHQRQNNMGIRGINNQKSKINNINLFIQSLYLSLQHQFESKTTEKEEQISMAGMENDQEHQNL